MLLILKTFFNNGHRLGPNLFYNFEFLVSMCEEDSGDERSKSVVDGLKKAIGVMKKECVAGSLFSCWPYKSSFIGDAFIGGRLENGDIVGVLFSIVWT